MAFKPGQFNVVEMTVKTHFFYFSINFNAEYVNGMTPFEFGHMAN